MRNLRAAAAIVLLVVTDALLKRLVRLSLGSRVLQWDGVFALRFVRNTGAAFSLFSAHTALLSVFTGLFLLAGLAVLFSGKVKNVWLRAAMILVLAGGAGNWIDRVRFGFVTDYIEPLFMRFAVFNFADILITVGAGLLIVWMVLDAVRDRQAKKAAPQ